jgi:hypothetical protein
MSLGSPRPYKSRVRVDVDLDANGLPTGASAVGRVEASPAEVFALLGAFDRYPGRVPMIHHARRVGHRVHVGLRFKVALFSTGFEFVADIHE